VERLVEKAPDSALYLLRQIQPKNLSSTSDRALYGILLFQALDKNFLPLEPDSIIDFSIHYYEREGNRMHLATACFYKARMCKYATRHEEATLLYLRALENFKRLTNYLLLGKIYSDMGEICSLQHQYHNARLKYQLSVDCFTKANQKKYTLYALLDVGRMYQYVHKHDSAHSCYRKALSLTGDSLDKGACLQEMALNYYSSEQYDSALHYLRATISYPYLGNNRAIRYYKLGALLLDLKQYDSAYYYTSRALKYYSDIYTRRECYRILADVESLKGHKQQTNIYIRNYVACMDSIQKIESQTKAPVLESFQEVKKQVTKTNRYLFTLLLIIPLFAVLVFISIIRLRKSHIRERDILIEKHLLTQSEINKKHIDILHRKIDEKKAHLAENRRVILSSERELMTRQLYDELLHLDDWDTFSHDMNSFFYNLIIRLEEEYPDITRKEITWCCLSLLQITHADILTLIEYKQTSYSKFKQRLAKKMNLNDAAELTHFLDQKVVKH
jgi:tetratricopeptide (TPR) repeat protein